jgi:acyl-CoA synthetase (AMP-forming)/AMP-acid ligase II
MSASRYWEDAQTTDAAFAGGGWFRSRDLGHLDGDGFLYYVDRARDEIATADGVVYPHVIEEAALRVADVSGAGAVGLGEPPLQQVVVAVTAKRPVGHELLCARVADEVATALPGHARTRVVVVEELPTVLGGAKVQREVLRGRLETEMAV